MSYSLARLEGRVTESSGTRKSKRKRENVPKHLHGQVIEAIDDDGSPIMVFINDEGKVCREFEVEDMKTSKKVKISTEHLDELLEEDSEDEWEQLDKQEEEEELKKLGIRIKHNSVNESDSESDYHKSDTESEYEDEEDEEEFELNCLLSETDEEAEQEAQSDDEEIKSFYDKQEEEEEEDQEG